MTNKTITTRNLRALVLELAEAVDNAAEDIGGRAPALVWCNWGGHR